MQAQLGQLVKVQGTGACRPEYVSSVKNIKIHVYKGGYERRCVPTAEQCLRPSSCVIDSIHHLSNGEVEPVEQHIVFKS